MSDSYPKVRNLKNHTIRVDKMPYKLTDGEKEKLSSIFSEVMTDLAFYAKEEFIEKLFSTEFLVRLYDKNANIIGFGNAANRVCGGIDVLHIMSIYVLRSSRGANLMDRTWMYFLVEQAKENNYCREKPFYFTASTVNAQVLYTSSRYYSIWPDLRYDTPIPDEVMDIAKGANEFYPEPGERLFQVKITEEYAGIKDGIGHDTRNLEFNKKFYGIADTNKMELVFFVGRIDANELTKLIELEQGVSQRKLDVSAMTH